MIEAIRSALDVKLSQDPDVLIFGEDVGYFGGVFRCTAGLQEKHGITRVFDAPIAEGGIVGAAVGMAAFGLRPVVEIQFADYIYPGYDQICSEAARLRYRSAGEFSAPLTIRTPVGGGIHGGQTHSQSPEALFTHISGLKTIIPSNPYDAKGLLIKAIEDNDPVLFLEPKRLYNGPFDGDPHKPAVGWSNHELADVPDGHYTIDFAKARTMRTGNDLSILCYGTMVWVAKAAAEHAAAQHGIDVEVIDLRSLAPLDLEAIIQSINKTGRCIVLHEATRTSGFGAELIAEIQQYCFYALKSPIRRITGWDTPYPHALEWEYFPGQARVGAAILDVMEP